MERILYKTLAENSRHPFIPRESQQPYAIVIGLDGMNGLQAARVLARRQVPVIAIAKDPKRHPSRTRVCETILFANTENEDFLETLEILGPRLKQKAVLFPCNDMNVAIVSRHRQRLEQWYHVMLPEVEIVETLMNKVSFYSYAQEHGIAIPRTYILESRADAENAASELNFPSILKPQVRSPEWDEHSKLKVHKVFSEQEMLAIYDRYHKWAKKLIAQEWVEGSDSNLYSCNCYFNSASEPIVTFVARKLRQWPPNAGKSCLGEECRNDIVLNETIRLFQGANYRGLGYLEMKKDERTGKFYVIEPNIGRPTGRGTIAEAGGVELLYTMYCDALGWPLPTNLSQQYTGVKWIYLRRDLQSAFYYWRKNELSFRDWWHSTRGRKTYAIFSWTDPLPFFVDLLRIAQLYLVPKVRNSRFSGTGESETKTIKEEFFRSGKS
jgi:predicted ATP-grasp superfamily ATP-dependent carboligase